MRSFHFRSITPERGEFGDPLLPPDERVSLTSAAEKLPLLCRIPCGICLANDCTRSGPCRSCSLFIPSFLLLFFSGAPPRAAILKGLNSLSGNVDAQMYQNNANHATIGITKNLNTSLMRQIVRSAAGGTGFDLCLKKSSGIWQKVKSPYRPRIFFP